MKKILYFALGISSLVFVSCGNGNSGNTNSDSSSMKSTDTSAQPMPMADSTNKSMDSAAQK